MSAQSAERLVYMANQIARNLALDGDPAATMAEHIRAFWTPRMIEDLQLQIDVELHPIATEALSRLTISHG